MDPATRTGAPGATRTITEIYGGHAKIEAIDLERTSDAQRERGPRFIQTPYLGKN